VEILVIMSNNLSFMLSDTQRRHAMEAQKRCINVLIIQCTHITIHTLIYLLTYVKLWSYSV